MSTENRWLLPEGIDELLPERAAQLEALRRRLLDQCATWGYRYVIPPLVEFTDSLLIGLGADLDVVTCKFTDQMSGRMLGVRADITPQTARMDAHSLAEEGVTRLCYAGSTLQSTPQSVISGRAPIQLGAELFGSSAIEADSEIIGLMLSTFQCAGVSRPLTLDIGHIGIYDALFSDAGLDPELEDQIFDALQRKSAPDIERLSASLPAREAERLAQLVALHGSPDVLASARAAFPDELAVMAALDQLDTVLARVQQAASEGFQLCRAFGQQLVNTLWQKPAIFSAHRVFPSGRSAAESAQAENNTGERGEDRARIARPTIYDRTCYARLNRPTQDCAGTGKTGYRVAAASRHRRH